MLLNLCLSDCVYVWRSGFWVRGVVPYFEMGLLDKGFLDFGICLIPDFQISDCLILGMMVIPDL